MSNHMTVKSKIKFDNLLLLESKVSEARINVFDRPNNCTKEQVDQLSEALRAAKQNLYDAVDDLSIEEGRQYAAYRITN